MASNLPTPRSYNQILSEMLSAYMARIGVNDLQTGSVITSLLEAVAQSVYRSSGDVFQILRDYSVDRASGEALQRIAAESRVYPIPAQVATGTITIKDSSFNKIATKIYTGDVSPNIGSTIIKVSDASLFTYSGQLYIGRGTNNIEGPISYSSIAQVGSYYEITLSTPTTKYHNISESVILAQGGVRNIPIGSSVKTIGTGGSVDVNFSTTQTAIMLDGENEISGIAVAALKPGSEGNISRNAIKEFISSPFTGATVFNTSPFTTGTDVETDDQLRDRVKKSQTSVGLGTSLAVKNLTLGATAKDENASVVSNEIFSSGTSNTILYVDNGAGYEEKSSGIGLEYIVDSALGGESYFQLATGGQQTAVTKAFLGSAQSGPFSIFGNYRLSILVGGVESEHIFNSTDFKSEGSATAYEIASSINANSTLLFVARTINNGTGINIYASSETSEYLQVSTPAVGTNAAPLLYLPTNRVDTLKLFKNKKPLQKDGIEAFLESAIQSSWSDTITSGETLILKIDNTQFITYTFTDSDFLTEGTYSNVNKNNSLASWINVINNKVIGATASISGNQIILKSNLGAAARASIEIDQSCSFVSNGIFSSSNSLKASGQASDFTLSRNTAQIKLTSPLSKGDSLTAGSDFTRAMIKSTPILGGSLTLSIDANVWAMIDNASASIINTGVVSNTAISISKPSSNVVRYTSNQSTAFANLQVGDYVIIWCNEINSNNRLEGRVHNLTNSYFDIKVTFSEYSLAQVESSIVISDGFCFIRSETSPQKIKVSAGTYNINDLAILLTNSITGATCSVDNDEILVLSSNTENSKGAILIPTFDVGGKSLNLTLKDSATAGNSLFAFFESNDVDHFFPSFEHDVVASDVYSDVPNSFITNFSATTTPDLTPNEIVGFLHPYSGEEDSQSAKESTQISYYSGNTVNISTDKIARRLRQGDRFYYASPYSFGYNDSIVVTLDSDIINKTFQIPLYRKLKTNSTAAISSNSFRAYDIESGATANINQFFPSFDFSNFKVLMQARNAITPKSNTVDQDSILFKSSVWGQSGEKYQVGLFYPLTSNSLITHTISTGNVVNISIFLNSGNAVFNTIDYTTEWNVTVVPNTPSAGFEEVTYVWSGVGSNPGMTSLVSGNYVTINSSGEFNTKNQGTFKIVSSTTTSFTIYRQSGEALAETGVATLNSSTISLYENSATTANDIKTYVNANIQSFITATLLNDNGTTGSGVIDTSTYDDIGSRFIQLKDGVNWILSSSVSSSAPTAQFVFKKTLDIASINTANANSYSFNSGEDLRIIPTTAKQVKDFTSILAVSGFTTVGRIETSNNENKIQLLSSVLGGNGSVQISGGSANNPITYLTSSASKINDKMSLTVNKSLAEGIESGYVKITANNVQQKNIGISNTTNITITPNSPSIGKSTITLLNLEPEDTYFDIPKFLTTPAGRTFHVEKHGKFVCVSWNQSGNSPLFSKYVNFKNTTSNMDVALNSVTGFTEYSSSSRNFSECSKGDSMTIAGFANTANNGTFNVIGVKSNGQTLIVDNLSGVTETAVSITNSNFSIFSEIEEGDSVVIGAPFSTLNRGTFKIVKRFQQSFYIENATAVEEIVIVPSTTISFGGDSTTEYDVSRVGNKTRFTYTIGTAPDFTNVKCGDYVTIGSGFSLLNRGEFMIVSKGTNYIELYNASMVVESGILGNSSLSIYSCNLHFYRYDAVLPLDMFTISGSLLGNSNIGSYPVYSLIDESNIVVTGILTSVTNVNLGNNYLEVTANESSPYIGYKKIHTIATDPNNSDNLVIVFEGSNQFEKINDSANIFVSSTSKLSLPESLVNGTDSYRYSTGLIGEVNRILYGDPRDAVTYPGVAAAGAEIFVQAPLVRRITVSVGVRVNTGVPFARITEQVRNNIAALINSSPIGKSIAISDIVSSVSSIAGVNAVSISSPTYSITNDVIVINPAEKPMILDAISDVTVSKIN